MAKASVVKPEVMDQRFVDGTVVTLEDAELRYCHLILPDTKYAKEWSCHVKISPEAAGAMKKIGFNIKEDDANGTYWLKVKSVCRTRSGVDQDPPDCTDPSGNPLSTEAGDGSVGTVNLWCKYTAPIQGKIHMAAYLNGVEFSTLLKKASQDGVKF